MTMYNTLLLDRDKWDLVLDAFGNIAMGAPPYALAQDVASAIKLFSGELWYNQTLGIPYFDQILGHTPPTSLVTGLMEQAAMRVPGVVSANCVINNVSSRTVVSTLNFTDESGGANSVNF